MATILVTGGTGTLGREVVSRLIKRDHTVRIMSRSASRLTPDSDRRLKWAQADMATDEGVAAAVTGVDTIVNCASSPFRQSKAVDVDGTARLLQHARRAGVSHVIHISITGIDRHPFSYYQNKVASEKLVTASGIPWTLLRAAQFHNLIDFFLSVTRRLPIMLIPTDFTFQPISVGEVADELVATLTPREWLPDMGGPEILRVGELASVWLDAQGLRKPIVHLPLPGKVAAAFRSGMLTSPDYAVGKMTWAQWVAQRYHKPQESGQYA
jgi:uncharacterized protein YbjT (DUF2867 family)